MRSQNTSTNASSMISSFPITGSVSHPNAGSALCVFFSFLLISAFWAGQEDILFVSGVLNCSVALRGASMREKPADEKSFHDKVCRFADRS